MPHQIALIATAPDVALAAKEIAQRWQFHGEHPHLELRWNGEYLALAARETRGSEVIIDLAGGASAYRRQKGGGKKEAVARAVGLKSNSKLRVVDATAGLGRDAFVLASLGCQVTLMERGPVIAALLEDGLRRAALDAKIGSWVQELMQLRYGSAFELLNELEFTPDVIYLDPMFPHKKKSALVKKEMQFFQQLAGPDLDADTLLPIALSKAAQRVVVKRPNYAPFLNAQQPDATVQSKKHRFDLYFCHTH